MAAYLQNWVQSSKDLPAELVRCFKLMQELDQRSHQLQQSVNIAAENLLNKVRMGTVPSVPCTGSLATATAPFDWPHRSETWREVCSYAGST